MVKSFTFCKLLIISGFLVGFWGVKSILKGVNQPKTDSESHEATCRQARGYLSRTVIRPS